MSLNSGTGSSAVKFNTDIIFEAFKPLEKLEKMIEQDKYNTTEDKLNILVNLLHQTEKGQKTAVDLRIKQKNFEFVKDLRDNFHNGRGLSKRDMLFCNNVWKRYK